MVENYPALKSVRLQLCAVVDGISQCNVLGRRGQLQMRANVAFHLCYKGASGMQAMLPFSLRVLVSCGCSVGKIIELPT